MYRKGRMIVLGWLLVIGVLFACHGTNTSKKAPSAGDELIGMMVMRTSDVDFEDGRVYADSIVEEKTKDKDGNIIVNQSYKFDKIVSIVFYYPRLEELEKGVYRALVSDEEVLSVNQNIGKEHSNITGTVRVITEAEGNYYCFGPIYRDKKGRVYTYIDTANYFVPSNSDGDSILSAEYAGYYIDNSNSRQQVKRFTIKLEVSSAPAPLKIRVEHTSSEGRVLKSEDCQPKDFPEVLHAHKEADYLIIKIYTTIEEDNYWSDMVGKHNKFYGLYYATEKGAFAQRFIEVDWSES